MTSARAEDAARRGVAAGARIEELRQVRLRIALGGRPTESDVRLAALRADESSDACEQAAKHAVEAHLRAAQAHRDAAGAADRAGQPAVACHHREAAAADDQAARSVADAGRAAGAGPWACTSGH